MAEASGCPAPGVNVVDDDDESETDEPRPLITNRGFLPSTIILLFFGFSVHFTHGLSTSFPNATAVLAIFLMAFMFEWQCRRARFTYGRLEARPFIDLVQLYQKQPYVRPDGTAIMATSVKAALVKASVIAALHRKNNPEPDEPEESGPCVGEGAASKRTFRESVIITMTIGTCDLFCSCFCEYRACLLSIVLAYGNVLPKDACVKFLLTHDYGDKYDSRSEEKIDEWTL